MKDKLQEIVNEARSNTTVLGDTLIVELKKESFDYLVEQADKGIKLQEVKEKAKSRLLSINDMICTAMAYGEGMCLSSLGAEIEHIYSELDGDPE